ncbi:hypothetical protein RHGRI_034206 [Rhododendron griersonianum]|uniref:Uncharacterized protein n=1 Tax=Rhododendron griersonianum TaxID=479676 RepID=A0AAV6I2A1_9ERIC|nr:hypothetical protein RHGRI_034206 [Rhododendron griersonianum]
MGAPIIVMLFYNPYGGLDENNSRRKTRHSYLGCGFFDCCPLVLCLSVAVCLSDLGCFVRERGVVVYSSPVLSADDTQRGCKQTFPNSGLLEKVFQEGGLAPYAGQYSQAVDMPCLADKHADRRGKKIKVWSIHMEGVLVREVSSVTMEVEEKPPKDNGCCKMYLILDRDPNPVYKPNFQDVFD